MARTAKQPEEEPAAPPEPPRTVHCDICNDEVPINGKATDVMTLGLHKRQRHGIVGKTNRDKPRERASKRANSEPQPVDLGDERPASLTLIHDAASQASSKKSAPTADELTRVLGKGYTLLGGLAWGAIVEGDPRYSDEAREEVIDALAPTPNEASATVRPVARLIAKLDVNKRYGRAIVENAEVLDTAAAVLEQARRARAYFSERRRYEQGIRTGAISPFPQTQTVVSPPGAPAPSHLPGFAPGTIVTPEMLGRKNVASYPEAQPEV